MKATSRRRWVVLLISLIVSLGFLWYALRDLYLGEVWAALRRAN